MFPFPNCLLASMHVTSLIIVLLPISSQTCECDDWSCNGYLYEDDPIQYQQCTNDNALWHDTIQCTYCSICLNHTLLNDTLLNDTYIVCSCDTQSNCNVNLNTINTISISTSSHHGTTWWVIALSTGGTITFIFVCTIIIYIYKMTKYDEELVLSNIIDPRQKSNTLIDEEANYSKFSELALANTASNKSINGNQDTQRPTLTIKVENIDVLKLLCPESTELNDYDLIFPQSYNDIDLYTKCLVVGYTRDILGITSNNKDLIHLIILYLFDNTVNFNMINKDFIMSSNGFCYGYHEWSLKIINSSIRRHEIGIVSILNPYTTIGSRSLDGHDMSICDMDEFGARTVYGTDCTTFYYASYNENNFERCYKQLDKYHRYTYLNEGDIVKIVLDLYKGNVTFYLNNKKIGKTIKIQKNKVYYPITTYFGRFRCELVHYK
eukprot:128863_1